MDRRQFTTLSAGMLASLIIAPRLAVAQDASPETGSSLLEGLGLPVLDVTVTADGIDAPTEIAAGPVLLIAHNVTDGGLTVDFTQLPDGTTADDYLALSSSEDIGIPAWVADLVLAGVVSVPPMGSGSIVLNLAPGDWTVIADSEAEIATPSLSLTVSGDAPAEVTIVADLDIEYGEYAFSFPATIAAGPQIWHVTNSHTVPHHAIIFPTDRLYTTEEVHGGVIAGFSGTPVAEGFSMDTSIVGPPFDLSVTSAGQDFWVEVDPAPGFYVAICFIADPGSDVPHVMQGMISTFEVNAS